jgi:copper transport protein
VIRPLTNGAWRRWPVAAAAALVALAAVPAASAHSVLIATEPATDAVVEESPTRVLLRFDEPVETALGSIRVYDGEARRVDRETISRPAPEEVVVELEDDLATGTYTVAWRAISADSDPISGAFVFHVGAPGAQPSGIAAELGEGTPLYLSVLYTGGRFFEFAMLLLCVGGLAALVLALGSAELGLRRRLYGILAVLGGALAVFALAGIVLQGAVAGGYSLGEALSWEVFSSVTETRYGEVGLIRAALGVVVVLLALALRSGSASGEPALLGLGLVAAVGLAVTPSFGGHASVAGSLALFADVMHVIAAGVWTGGLAFVVFALLRAGSERWPLAARSVPRFSNVAVASVVVLVLAGAASGYFQVRTWRGLWETQYGLLLLAKISLVVPLLALGAYNNRYAVPRLRRQIASALEQRRFLRAAAAELTIMVAIVAVTAVLVNAPPARTEVVMHGPVEEVVQLGDLRAHVSIEPGMPGENDIHVMFEGGHGGAGDIEELTLAVTLPAEEIGPLQFTAERAQHAGEWVARGAAFPLAGEWELRIEARRGEFELLTETVPIEIREES